MVIYEEFNFSQLTISTTAHSKAGRIVGILNRAEANNEKSINLAGGGVIGLCNFGVQRGQGVKFAGVQGYGEECHAWSLSIMHQAFCR